MKKCSVALILSISLIACSPSSPAPDADVGGSTIVFVHGAWGGGWQFHKVAPLLRRAGHSVYRPTLTGLGEPVMLPS